FFFVTPPSTSVIYTLSLHDALPISFCFLTFASSLYFSYKKSKTSSYICFNVPLEPNAFLLKGHTISKSNLVFIAVFFAEEPELKGEYILLSYFSSTAPLTSLFLSLCLVKSCSSLVI